MKLRNGAHVDRVLDVNPAATSAIAQHNASIPLLRLPLEVKNQIYKYTFGGNLIHVIQNIDKGGPKFKSYVCLASISEEEAQENFDSESTHPWYAPANEGRHRSCHKSLNAATIHKITEALILSPLRSCRQMYNEAHHIPYSANTFGCFDPKTLQSFVTLLAQGSKDNHLAVRSLFLEIFHAKRGDMSSWKKALATCTKHLTAIQNVSISIDLYDFSMSSLGRRASDDLEKVGAVWKDCVISSLLSLKKMPLKTATMVISDKEAELDRSCWYGPVYSRWINLEAAYRWTLDEKKERARYVREVLLQSQI